MQSTGAVTLNAFSLHLGTLCEGIWNRSGFEPHAFLLDTGMRAGELAALNGGEIELKTGTVRRREANAEKSHKPFVPGSTPGGDAWLGK